VIRKPHQHGFAGLDVVAIIGVAAGLLLLTSQVAKINEPDVRAVHDLRVVEVVHDGVVIQSKSDGKSEGVVVKGGFGDEPGQARLSLVRQEQGGLQHGPILLCNWTSGICRDAGLKNDGHWEHAVKGATTSTVRLF
jgi:hypothetical protein